jgi:hypothetical protein
VRVPSRKKDMNKGLIERLRDIGRMHAPDTTCEEAGREIERLQAELLQKAADAGKAAQLYEDTQRENVELRERVRLLETALKTIADEVHKALEVE